jgi:hypothetical protein
MEGHSTLRAGLKNGSGGRETVKNEVPSTSARALGAGHGDRTRISGLANRLAGDLRERGLTWSSAEHGARAATCQRATAGDFVPDRSGGFVRWDDRQQPRRPALRWMRDGRP